MSIKWKVILVVIGILAALCNNFYKNYLSFSKFSTLPAFDTNEYWGPGDVSTYEEDQSIKPFKIIFEGKVFKDLKDQLKREIEFLPNNEDVFFQYGFNVGILKDLIKFWRDDYLLRWKERENFFNSLEHFKTEIQGLNIHFIHEKLSENVKKSKKVYPLLILHGWPGSIREFYDIIQLFKKTNEEIDYAFEIVAPSLPGFGWSQAASKTGMGPIQITIVLRKLMMRLGYEKFFIQGGDFGSVIASVMATIYPENVLGYHSNMCLFSSLKSILKQFIGSLFPKYFIEEDVKDFYPPISHRLLSAVEETGYFHFQATKPDTIGIVLSHNPFGLAAYILEKILVGTNPALIKSGKDFLKKYYSLDSLIDNLMVYYLTNSITSSCRIYKNTFANEYSILELDRIISDVPYGCASFQYEIGHSFDWQIKDKFPNLIHHTYYRNIGHFAAMQAPKVLYKDIIKFVNRTLESNKKIIKILLNLRIIFI